MLSTVFKYLATSVSILKPTFVSHSLTVTRGRRLWMRPYLASLYKRRIDQGPEPDRPRSAWLNWNYDAEIYAFGKRLGEDFNSATLKRAFIMSSYLEKEQKERLKLGLTEDIAQVDLVDNRQLVNLGEQTAVTCVDFFLRKYFPQLPAEGISAVTSYLLSEDLLSHIASNVGIGDLVQTAEFPVCTHSLSSVFKAVIGALLQDQGKQRAETFVQDFVLTQLIGKDLFEMWSVSNPMGLLIETLHKQGRSEPEPSYLVTVARTAMEYNEDGQRAILYISMASCIDHLGLLWSTGSETILASYVVGIYVDRQLVGQAPGETVSIAEEMAARDALRRSWCPSHLPFDRKTTAEDNSVAGRKLIQKQRT